MTKQDSRKPDIQPVTFSPYLVRRHHARLRDWLQANGIDPATVSTTHPIRVEEGKGGPVIGYRVGVLADGDEQQTETEQTGEELTEDRTAPCTVPPPDLGTTAQPEHEAGE